jgi:hypothetical protein
MELLKLMRAIRSMPKNIQVRSAGTSVRTVLAPGFRALCCGLAGAGLLR